VALFTRSLQIADEDAVDEVDEGLESGSLPDWIFSFSGHRVSEGFAHLAAMDAEFLGDSFNGSDAMFKLASNLFK
jgi:hypothetical protein